MKYFYYPPYRKQYFFPYRPELKVLFDFYKPYSYKSKILWELCKKNKLLRYYLSIDENKIPADLDYIRSFLGRFDYSFAINLGTPGVEQKTSLLVVDEKAHEIYFIKYSNKTKAKELSRNEIKILSQTKGLYDFMPSIIKFNIDTSRVIFMTEYLKGDQYENTNLNTKLFRLILKISKIRIDNINSYGDENLKKCFSHGDFCPWNLLLDNNKIKIIDWEMAGYYPLGYDLFTFIFQTNFLLSGKTTNKILNSNKKYIIEYFKTYDIIDWKPYLKEFASIKLRFEKEKNNSELLKHYQKLIYYEKT